MEPVRTTVCRSDLTKPAQSRASYTYHAIFSGMRPRHLLDIDQFPTSGRFFAAVFFVILLLSVTDIFRLSRLRTNRSISLLEQKMIHVLLRIAVWVAVFGIGYLVFGPELFDSSHSTNPFESNSKIFLPPAKSAREIKYEEVMKKRKLEPGEAAEYQSLVVTRKSKFWQQEGVSVEEALSGVKKQRKQRLTSILQQRGLSNDESAVFLMVVQRDHPALLEDQE